MAIPFHLTRSQSLRANAEKYIPGGMIDPNLLIAPDYPIYIEHAEGAYCWDVDGNRYIDFILGFGPIILGHSYPCVRDAVHAELDRGLSCFEHPLQNKLAQMLTRIIPCAEQVYFMKTGSCATTAAVRLARIHTKRDVVLHAGYNGWHDWALANNPNLPNVGIPSLVALTSFSFDANDLENLEQLLYKHREKVACIVIAPEAIGNTAFLTIAEIRNCLENIQGLARQHGSVLIFDEIKTGFRLALGGIQELCGVIPDLATFSKGLANGLPLSVVAGRRDIMSHVIETKLAGTFNSEVLAIAAAISTIEELIEKHALLHIWRMGELLIDGINKAARSQDSKAIAGGRILAPMPLLRFPHLSVPDEISLTTRVAIECIRRGVLIHPWHNWYVSFAHQEEDILTAVSVIADALETMDATVEMQLYPKD